MTDEQKAREATTGAWRSRWKAEREAREQAQQDRADANFERNLAQIQASTANDLLRRAAEMAICIFDVPPGECNCRACTLRAAIAAHLKGGGGSASS